MIGSQNRKGGAVEKDEFILRAKIDELDIESHKIVQKFPRTERHVLAAEIRSILNNIIRYEERAGKMQLSERRRAARPVQTLELLQRLDAELGLLKRQINKADALGYLQAQGMTARGRWSGMAIEVGSVLGGWIKTVENRVYPYGQRRQSPEQGKL